MGYTTGVKKKWWCGIEGIYSIFNWAWSDPEIGYKGYAINEHFATDGFWELYNEEVPAPDYKDREAYAKYEDGFDKWLQKNKEMVFSDLDEIIENYEENIKEEDEWIREHSRHGEIHMKQE